mmetsp:Transcript_40968/g.122314  ORF Transcript_40968/g.122314 Transcript_40968/m.122314 type:complete len:385 (+) Transcript_40968:1152-2306(+)
MLLTEALVLLAVDSADRRHALERAGHLLVLRRQLLAVAAPRRIELDERDTFSREAVGCDLQHVVVALIEPRLGRLPHAAHAATAKAAAHATMEPSLEAAAAHVEVKVGAATTAAATAHTAAKEHVEHVHWVAAAEAGAATRAARRAALLEALLAMHVVQSALFRVGQSFICLRHLLELLLGLLLVLHVAVWVPFQCLPPICLFDVLLRRVLSNTQDVVVLAIATCQHMLGACRQRQQQQQHRRQRGPSGSAAHACPTAERCSSSAGRGLPFFAGPAVCRCADRHCSCVLLDRLSEQDLRQEREVTRALPTPGNRETVGSEAAHVDATAPLVSASPVAPRRCARSLRGREAAGTARVGSLGKGVGPSTPPHARKRVPLPHPGCST